MKGLKVEGGHSFEISGCEHLVLDGFDGNLYQASVSIGGVLRFEKVDEEINPDGRSIMSRGEFVLTFPAEEDEALGIALAEQAHVLLGALNVYSIRNRKYKDNWRRFGWRGVLFRIRERAERLWDEYWDIHPLGEGHSHMPDLGDGDDAYDLINFAAIMVRAIKERNRDGSWW